MVSYGMWFTQDFVEPQLVTHIQRNDISWDCKWRLANSITVTGVKIKLNIQSCMYHFYDTYFTFQLMSNYHVW